MPFFLPLFPPCLLKPMLRILRPFVQKGLFILKTQSTRAMIRAFSGTHIFYCVSQSICYNTWVLMAGHVLKINRRRARNLRKIESRETDKL
jgi:hypothetical protein